jgi:folate-dependent tRNA-U54 methylase TrmFO/GidA
MKEMTGAKTMTLKQFNDAFLREGEMPIEMMRAALGNRTLTRDYQASWAFYGQVEPAGP